VRDTSGERRAIAVLRGVGLDLVSHQALELRARLQDHRDLGALGLELIEFSLDLHLLELGEVAQLGFEDVVGLGLAQLEARHQLRLGLVLAPDDADHLVEIQVGDAQAFQQVQALVDLVEPELQAPAHRVLPELQPLRQQRLEVLELRAAVEADHVQG
jgi:hypothetical protein